MLKRYKPVRADKRWYTVFVPVRGADLLKMFVPGLVIATVVAVWTRDTGVFVVSLALGYVALAFVMRGFEPYEVAIDKSDLRSVVELLDRTPVLSRVSEEYRWQRAQTPSWLRSNMDEISIRPENFGWIVRGRRDDLTILASALNRNARQGT